MNAHYKKKLGILLAALISFQHVVAFNLTGTAFFQPRSQSENAARDMVGWHSLINRYDTDQLYGAIEITPSFGQILRARRVAEALFNNETLRISGSLIPNRGFDDILADYFGLSPAFESTVCIKPFIRTVQCDLGFYLGWGDFYFRAHAPALWTRWQLGILEEDIAIEGSNVPYPANYMAATEIQAPARSFEQAVQGGITWGQNTTGLLNGKFGCSRTKTGLSDLQCALGWFAVNNYCGYAGFNLRVVAPTGSRPNSEFLFEPIVGNGKHWELGAGFNGRVLLWEKDGEQEISFFADVNITTLLNARQRRSFDFKINGFGSRYILVKEFDASGGYIGSMQPAINITTLNVNVRNSIQMDFAFMFAYTYNEFLFDFGYNVWLRSHDIISLKQCIPENKYGLKGIQDVTAPGGINIPTTQSEATLHGNQLVDQALVADPNPPVFIRTQDLDILSGSSTFMLTQKVFAHLGRVWNDRPCRFDIVPYFGVGGEIEFEGINERGQKQPSKETLSQWSIWLKGGFGF